MKSLTGREFARLIERPAGHCFVLAESHHIYGKSGSVVRLSVPIHGNKPMKTGLLRHLMKLADVLDEDL